MSALVSAGNYVSLEPAGLTENAAGRAGMIGLLAVWRTDLEELASMVFIALSDIVAS